MYETLDVISIEDIEKIERESKEYCDLLHFYDNYNLEWLDLTDLKTVIDESIIDESNYLNQYIYKAQHGLRHHLRVQIYSYILLKKCGYSDVDIKLMNYICSIHDTQRKNDFKDHDHGLLAYEKYIAANDEYDEETKKRIKEVLENHDSKIKKIDNLFLMILKCADALDRFRLKNLKGWINFDRIPISDKEELMSIRNEAKKMVMLCRKFTLLTEKYRTKHDDMDDYDVIIKNLRILKRKD